MPLDWVRDDLLWRSLAKDDIESYAGIPHLAPIDTEEQLAQSVAAFSQQAAGTHYLAEMVTRLAGLLLENDRDLSDMGADACIEQADRWFVRPACTTLGTPTGRKRQPQQYGSAGALGQAGRPGAESVVG